MSPVTKKFILMSVVLAIVLLTTIFVNITIMIEKNKLQKKYDRLETDLQFILSKSGDLTEMVQSHKEVVLSLFEKSNRYDTELSYLKDIGSLKNNASRYNIDVTELVPKMEDSMPLLKNHITINDETLERYEIDLKLTGKFHDIGKFLIFLDKDDKRIYINKIVLNKLISSDGLKIDALIKAYSYGLRKL